MRVALLDESYLTEQQLEGRDVVSGETEGILILTHNIPLKAGVWLQLQVLHATEDLSLNAHKLCMPAALRKQKEQTFKLT